MSCALECSNKWFRDALSWSISHWGSIGTVKAGGSSMTKPLCQRTKQTRQILTFRFVDNVCARRSFMFRSFFWNWFLGLHFYRFGICILQAENLKCFFRFRFVHLGSTRIATGASGWRTERREWSLQSGSSFCQYLFFILVPLCTHSLPSLP